MTILICPNTSTFDDSDIHVIGPIAKTMRQTFDKFFDHEITERPTFPEDGMLPNPLRKYDEKTAAAKEFLKVTHDEKVARARMESAGQSYLKHKNYHVCPTTTFSTDAPGANLIERAKSGFNDKYRFLRKTLHDKISVVDKHIILSSPYMIDGKATEEMMDMLLRNGARIDIYTNSLASTDATYVAANMYLGLANWRAHGINVFLNDGKWMPKNMQTPLNIRKADFGTHSKVQVYETKTYTEVMVGTYNIDHRSNYYNAEMALFCKGNDALTDEVKASINVNTRYALKVAKDGKSVINRDGKRQSVYGASKADIIKMKVITLPSWLAKELL